jgi:hypothetical protein
MSDLVRVPKPNLDNIVVVADFAEIECLRRDDLSVSTTDLTRIIQRQHDGASDEDVQQVVDEAFAELAERSRHCGKNNRYPFHVSDSGTLVKWRHVRIRRKEIRVLATTYLYLLLATRMNMKSERVHADEDATVLFELLCREVIIRYWGGPSTSVKAIVFGTGRYDDRPDDDEIGKRGFVRAVNDLCQRLQEGQRFHPVDEDYQVTAKDGKLDIVVWRCFADNRAGQLIGFGQCKTGTHWPNDLQKLQPDAFCDKWLLTSPAVLPVRLYFVADRVVTHWYDTCRDGGIVFDRCRIMEHTSDLPDDLVLRMSSWVNAALKAKGLKLP